MALHSSGAARNMGAAMGGSRGMVRAATHLEEWYPADCDGSGCKTLRAIARAGGARSAALFDQAAQQTLIDSCWRAQVEGEDPQLGQQGHLRQRECSGAGHSGHSCGPPDFVLGDWAEQGATLSCLQRLKRRRGEMQRPSDTHENISTACRHEVQSSRINPLADWHAI